MTGQSEKAKELAERNVEIFKEAGIETIITSCAGCYRTWKDTPSRENHSVWLQSD